MTRTNSEQPRDHEADAFTQGLAAGAVGGVSIGLCLAGLILIWPSSCEPTSVTETHSPGRRAFALNTDMGCVEYNCDLGIEAMVFEVVYDPPLATPADEVAP